VRAHADLSARRAKDTTDTVRTCVLQLCQARVPLLLLLELQLLLLLHVQLLLLVVREARVLGRQHVLSRPVAALQHRLLLLPPRHGHRARQRAGPLVLLHHLLLQHLLLHLLLLHELLLLRGGCLSKDVELVAACSRCGWVCVCGTEGRGRADCVSTGCARASKACAKQ
jgi:hypothetical protein